MLKAVGDPKGVIIAEIKPCSHWWQYQCTAGACDAAGGIVLSLVSVTPVLFGVGRVVFCTFLVSVCLQSELVTC